MNDWGRIFFIYDDDNHLNTIYAQPLSNHSGNCRALLERFDTKYFDNKTKSLLFRAVDLHDEGKRETFRIYEEKAETNSSKSSAQGKRTGRRKRKKLKDNTITPLQGEMPKPKLRYSFAGHRFRVSDDDPYVSMLIRAHHEFSVSEINRGRAQLASLELKKRFPNDLYLLCMADQLEAELAVKTVEKKNTVSRTFMEFVTQSKDATYKNYTVVPWPFAAGTFDLSFELFELPAEYFQGEDRKKIEQALKEKSLSVFKRQEMTIRLSGDISNDY